jgi:uncharacterized protein
MSTVTLTGSRAALLVLAGFGAGAFNGIAGGGTLISFPTLLALGYPALTANVTSTVGILSGYLSSIAGFRREVAAQKNRFRVLAPVTVAGAAIGAVLLLTTPSSAFTRLAPWLVLFATALFAIAPIVARRLSRSGQQSHPLALAGGVFCASVYGGYFGAGVGIILLAIIGLTLPENLAHASGIRAILSVLANGIAAVVFVLHGGLAWAAAGWLALGCLVGGFVGAVFARRVPVTVLRVIIVAIGLATGIRLLTS